jgi:hypothetical protein
VANNREDTDTARAGQGLTPDWYGPFDEFCLMMGLSRSIREHLLASLQLANRDDEFIELNREQRFVTAAGGWRHLAMIRPLAKADAARQSVRKNEKRKSKGGDG